MTKLAQLGRILKGHFYGGPKVLLSRFTWEILQTTVGACVALYAWAMLKVQNVELRDGVIVIQAWRRNRSWGGLCLGSVILGDERIAAQINNRLYMHEFGHTLQSRLTGPLYFFKYGIPSILSVGGKGQHNLHPVEQDANLRACRYFSAQKGFQAWPSDFNPLPVDANRLPVQWWEFIPPIFPIQHLYQAYRDRNGRLQ